MTPRPYQSAAIESLFAYLASSDGNPCIVLPTGAGKTPTMAWTIQQCVTQWPDTRVMVLAHIRELLEQGVEKMRAIWPQAPVGVYSAGLGSRDMNYSVTYASIQSVFKRACDFPPFDLIFIDEAHRIPLEQEGQYRQFLRDAKLCNPHIRVVGWTATPYRLAGGDICHKDFILNEVVYTANVKQLIDDGHLAPLRTKLGANEVDTSGVKKSRGEFNAKQLEAAAMVDETVDGIASEAVEIINRERRNSVLFFCCGVDHCDKMSRALAALGVDAPTIHANTSSVDRAARGNAFKAGRLRALCNVNVLSEGFDAQRVDAVVMIRPTQSKGLYYQQVGRGLRTFAGKTDCLVLDFAGNIVRHGPIDHLEGSKTEMVTCGGDICREHFARVINKCPACGWDVPPPTPKFFESEVGEPKKRIIPTDPNARTEASILSGGEPWEMKVETVVASVHQKDGKKPTLKVEYRAPGGMESHREWICLGHDGYAGHKARSWWRARFGDPVPGDPADAMAANLFLGQAIADATDRIVVKQVGKYTEVSGVKFKRTAESFAG